MKDCSLKICLNCGRCKRIVFSSKGWWMPTVLEINCFSQSKGESYGPTEKCDFKFEHLVLDKRRSFKLNNFEDYNDLYEFLRENKISFKNPFSTYFYSSKELKFYEQENYLNFKEFICDSSFYQNGIENVLFDDKNLKFVKENKQMNIIQSNWLSKFAKKRMFPNSVQETKNYRHKIVFPVAGVTFEDRQETIKRLSNIFNSGKRMEVEFIPEPENIYDKNAIKINVLNNGNREFVGYVPKTLNKDQDNESKIENFNEMINSIIDNIENAETSWIGEKNGTYGVRIVCYEKLNN